MRRIGSSGHVATYLSGLRHCSDIRGEVVSGMDVRLTSTIFGVCSLDGFDRSTGKLGRGVVWKRWDALDVR